MRKSRRRGRKSIYRDLVRQRQQYIYRLALEKAREGDLDYAARLGQYLKWLARDTGVRLPRDIKRGICKNCGLPLIPGLTASVRLNSQGGLAYRTIRCLKCGWIHRYPYRRWRKHGSGMEEGEESASRETGRDSREEGVDARGSTRDRLEVEE